MSLFLGGPDGPSLVPSRRLDSPLAVTDHFGLSLAGIDLDQDGLSDLAVGRGFVRTARRSPPLVYAGARHGTGRSRRR